MERIESHPRYGALMRNAVAAQEELVLNYHTHGAGQPYCVAVGVYDGAIAQLGIDRPEGVQAFTGMGYGFRPELSAEFEWTFTRDAVPS